jgi:hypothetical protein
MVGKANRSPYSVHPAVLMTRKWIDALPEKTGKSLEEWIALVKASGPSTLDERREWLKAEHGFGTNNAHWIAERCDGLKSEDDDPDAYLITAQGWVDAMFAGKKAALRPIYDALLALRTDLGPDVRLCPCSTIVPFYRNHVFAQIKPSTNTRIDFGFALGDREATGRLIDTGGFAKKDRITHRIPITRLDEIDDEVRRWLKTAYDRDATPTPTP